jgi:hypothetical protein
MPLLLLLGQYPPTGNGDAFQAPQHGSGTGLISFASASGSGTPSAPVMRTYGRAGQVNGYGGQWVVVTTDAAGFNDSVYLLNLVQVLKLGLGESPVYSNYGIPATQSVIQQIFPDYYLMQTQTQFAPYFASLVITRVPTAPTPTYDINVVTHSGAVISQTIVT